MNEPQPVTVTRWRCATPGCRKSYATRTSARAHATECPRDPANRSCLTCAHFTNDEPGGWADPGHPAACDLELPVGGRGTGEPMPRDCPTWAPPTMTAHPHFFRTRGDAGHPTGRPHLVHRRHDDGPDPYLEINHGPDCGQTELLAGLTEPDCDIAWQLHHGGPLEDQLPYSGDPLPAADTFWVEGWHRTIDLGPAGTEHDAGIRLTHPPQSHG